MSFLDLVWDKLASIAAAALAIAGVFCAIIILYVLFWLIVLIIHDLTHWAESRKKQKTKLSTEEELEMWIRRALMKAIPGVEPEDLITWMFNRLQESEEE